MVFEDLQAQKLLLRHFSHLLVLRGIQCYIILRLCLRTMSFLEIAKMPNWLAGLWGLDNFCYSSFLSHQPHLPYSNYFPRGLVFGLPRRYQCSEISGSITRKSMRMLEDFDLLWRKGDKSIYHTRNSFTLLCLISIVSLQPFYIYIWLST